MSICKSIENAPITSADGEKVKRSKYQSQPILVNIRHLRATSSMHYKRVGSLITAKRNPAVNRLIISFDLQRNVYEFRWCNYESRNSRSLTVSRKQLKRPSNFSLAFCRLNIQRILFQNLPSGSLNDVLINFLCQQFQNCLVFKPKCIIAKNVSMKALNSNGLMELFSVCSKSLESVQFHGITGLRPTSITDAHLAILDPTKLRSLTIEKVSFEPSYKNGPLLQIGDKSLERFSRDGYFPTLVLEKCRMTAKMVCQYSEKWLAKKAAESEQRNIVDVKSHMFVLKDSPAADNIQFERECRRRSLDFEQPATDIGNAFRFPVANSCDESETISYNVHKDEAHQEFTVTLSTASAMYE
ncbi:F-box domain protein [Ditylenchus destructor]|nr:F-box domain protein [Ditylenchus destructor]